MAEHPLGQWQPCPTCCPTGCVYFSDNFNRTDDTDLGADWTETAGDWEIVSNTVQTSDADAVLTCDEEHPTASNKYIAVVTVKFDTDGDIARLVIADGDYYAEVERITSTCCRVRLYDNTGADPVCLGSSGGSLSPWARIVVCSEEDKIHVSIGGSFPLTIPSTVTSSVVSIETGTCTGTVSFEDFALSKHYEDDNTCPACGDEGCTWFADSGCASGSLSATDWTTTGTWTYTSGLKCTANGAITVVPEQPLGAVTYGVAYNINRPSLGVTVRLFYDASLDAYVEVEGTSSSQAAVSFWSGGVQYGRRWHTVLATVPVKICWDGTNLVARYSGKDVLTNIFSYSAYIPGTPSAFFPHIAVSGLSGGATHTTLSVVAVKDAGDIGMSGECQDCGTPGCTSCAAGTFPTNVQVVIGGLTSVVYGCTCTDVTIPLYALGFSSSCSWEGVTTGPCGSGSWTGVATIAPVTGGYKLTVVVTVSDGNTATFENTVLSGSPVDCLTAFDGDVPRTFSMGPLHCTLGSATCTFTSPAP